MRVGMGLTRDQEIDYAIERGIEIPITKASPYSIDVNLWGRSCETGVLEDPWVTPPPDAYEWTVAPSDAPGAGRARRSSSRAASRSRSTASGSTRSSSSSASTSSAARTASAGSTTSRTASSGSRAARSTRRRRRRSCTRRIGALEGLTLTKDTLRFNRLVAERARPADLRRAVVQRPPSRPARLRGVVPAGRVAARSGSGSTTARRSSTGRRSPLSLYDKNLATYDDGRRVRPRGGGRVHRDLRAAAAGRGGAPRRGRARATARPGRGRIRSSRTCRRRSPIPRSRSPRADPRGPRRAAPAAPAAAHGDICSTPDRPPRRPCGRACGRREIRHSILRTRS